MSLSESKSVDLALTTRRRSSVRDIAKQSMYDMLSHLAPGQKLPAERELAQMFSASRKTVRAVLDELEQSSVIARQQGRGTFLRDITLLLKERAADKSAIEVLLPDTSNPMIAPL